MWKVVLPAAAMTYSFAMGLAFRLWFWDTEQIIVAIGMLGTPLLLIVFAVVVPIRRNEMPRAPSRGVLIGAATGLAWMLGVLVPYALGSESCDDSTGDISCEGAAVLSLVVLVASGAAAGAMSGVLIWLFHDVFLVRRLPQPDDER